MLSRPGVIPREAAPRGHSAASCESSNSASAGSTASSCPGSCSGSGAGAAAPPAAAAAAAAAELCTSSQPVPTNFFRRSS